MIGRTALRLALAAALLSASAAQAADRWALLVGIDEYQAMSKLRYCGADAQALARALKDRAGFALVKVLTDTAADDAGKPTLANIQRNITNIAGLARPGDTVLVFFSGHGAQHGGDALLVPVDGDRNLGVSLGWAGDQLKQSKASFRLLIIDACHSGSGAKGVSGIAPNVTAPGLVMMLSCARDQESYPDAELGHSIFTWHLIQGLSGEASGRDGRLTCRGLYDYVDRRVRAWSFQTGRQQYPLLVGIDDGDLPLTECAAVAPSVAPSVAPAAGFRAQPAMAAAMAAEAATDGRHARYAAMLQQALQARGVPISGSVRSALRPDGSSGAAQETGTNSRETEYSQMLRRALKARDRAAAGAAGQEQDVVTQDQVREAWTRAVRQRKEGVQ